MLQRIRARIKSKASYSFYVWEDGAYVHVDGGHYESDKEAASAAMGLSADPSIVSRPTTLDAAHLHVVREDGVHILTLELPEKSQQSIAA